MDRSPLTHRLIATRLDRVNAVVYELAVHSNRNGRSARLLSRSESLQILSASSDARARPNAERPFSSVYSLWSCRVSADDVAGADSSRMHVAAAPRVVAPRVKSTVSVRPAKVNGLKASRSRHSLLQVEPAQTGQLQVQNETAWRVRPTAGQKLLRGSEGLGLKPRGPDEPFKPLPYRGVVVHDCDNSIRQRGLHLVLRPGISER